jgi:hypothetical protein
MPKCLPLGFVNDSINSKTICNQSKQKFWLIENPGLILELFRSHSVDADKPQHPDRRIAW